MTKISRALFNVDKWRYEVYEFEARDSFLDTEGGITVTEAPYLTNVLKVLIGECLDTLDFQICDEDGEYLEDENEKLIEEIKDAIMDDKPNNIFLYIKKYININY